MNFDNNILDSDNNTLNSDNNILYSDNNTLNSDNNILNSDNNIRYSTNNILNSYHFTQYSAHFICRIVAVALGIAVESPQRSEDLERKARPLAFRLGERPQSNSYMGTVTLKLFFVE